MSRLGGPTNSRNLSLTEELERLEQSITLTLQEIDHNFSKAHRIVTSSILPVVEQYAQHSRDVWEGSRFWKQFFEASANVSLSGYQEGALEEDVTQQDTTAMQETTMDSPSVDYQGDQTITPQNQQYADEDDEEESSIMDSPSNATGVHSTPQIKTKGRQLASPSPMKAHALDHLSTPLQDRLILHSSSPFEPPSAYQPSTAQRQQNPDPIMHRIMDRNFRVQATPHTARKQARAAAAAAPAETPATQTRTRTLFGDSSPMSSPEMAAPQLRSDLFSPERPIPQPRATPRTPGISVQTPGRNVTTSTGRPLFSTTKDTTSRTLWESDSDEDDTNLGISPPKTMQFHVPQSRLMQTPAREASRIIVDDLLATAGADRTESIEGDSVPDISPSIVRRGWEDEDDTF